MLKKALSGFKFDFLMILLGKIGSMQIKTVVYIIYFSVFIAFYYEVNDSKNHINFIFFGKGK